MSKVDWSKAPEGAEFFYATRFRRIINERENPYFWSEDRQEWTEGSPILDLIDCIDFEWNPESKSDETGRDRQAAEHHDPVNKPKHYAIAPDVEAIDIIRSSLTPEQFKGYLLGNFLKYRLRAGDKGDLQQDIDKSNWYKRELNK